MPRPKKDGGASEPKKRSRNGCWPCKARKVKCGEEKPQCLNCERQGDTCDYSIRLNWGGRSKRKDDDWSVGSLPGATTSPYILTFPTPEALTGTPTPPAIINYPDQPSMHRTSPKTQRPNTSAPVPTTLADIDSNVNRSFPSASCGWSSHKHGYMSDYVGDESLQANIPGNSMTDEILVPLDPRLQDMQYQANADYPSPSLPNQESANTNGNSNLLDVGSKPIQSLSDAMPPPFRPSVALDSPLRSASFHRRSSTDTGHQAKRIKLSPPSDFVLDPIIVKNGMSFNTAHGPMAGDSQQTAYLTFSTPYSPLIGTPMTPNSSIASDDNSVKQGPRLTPMTAPSPPNLRRLSVHSLLSGPLEDMSQAFAVAQPHARQHRSTNDEVGMTTYGYDLGQPDLDTPKNDDLNAIMVYSPPPTYRTMPFGTVEQHDDVTIGVNGSPESRAKDIAFEPGGYYSDPVPIKIPKSMEPLPPRLLENPINLLYFHHFLNHTARILVPHDCEGNPFRNVLPYMALHDEDLLNLLLAFSASHRARLLNHPEPANRIALWVQDVFPRLRRALYDSTEPISTSTLTTAIVLASLEIVVPNTFEVHVSWQNHLTIARQMIIAMGGAQSLHRKDKVSYFLSRWFAYLDVLGSLSGSKNDWPLSSGYWSDVDMDGEDEFQIDCLLGFTSRFISILARVAELAKQCEGERIDADGNVREDWQPIAEVVEVAEQLKIALQEGREHVCKGCTHGKGTADNESETGWDSLEIYATNEAFHWAGYIHLSRRVLGRPTSDPDVQHAVREIVGALCKVRRGSTAEACLLFPMFTAGCYAADEGLRQKIMERLKGVEGFGLTQVHNARTLMQKVWDTGKPWETLVSDEFFG